MPDASAYTGQERFHWGRFRIRKKSYGKDFVHQFTRLETRENEAMACLLNRFECFVDGLWLPIDFLDMYLPLTYVFVPMGFTRNESLAVAGYSVSKRTIFSVF